MIELKDGYPTRTYTLEGGDAMYFFFDVYYDGTKSMYNELLSQLDEKLVFFFNVAIPSPMITTDGFPNVFCGFPPPTPTNKFWNPIAGRYFYTVFNPTEQAIDFALNTTLELCGDERLAGEFCVPVVEGARPGEPFRADIDTSVDVPYQQPQWVNYMEIFEDADELALQVRVTEIVNAANVTDADWPLLFLAYGGPAGPDMDFPDLRANGVLSCRHNDFVRDGSEWACSKRLDLPKQGRFYFSAFGPAAGPAKVHNNFEMQVTVSAKRASQPFKVVELHPGERVRLDNSTAPRTVFALDIESASSPKVLSVLACPVGKPDLFTAAFLEVGKESIPFENSTPECSLPVIFEYSYPFWYLYGLGRGRYYFYLTGLGDDVVDFQAFYEDNEVTCMA